MRHLLIVAVFIGISILFATCSHKLDLKGSKQKPPKSPIIPAVAVLDEPGQPISEIPIHRESSQEEPDNYNLLAIMGVVSLLLIWFLYHQLQTRGRRKKGISLDETDMAMLGLAADTLSNLWRRLHEKSTAKIISFHRRG